jgi:hypothetical protein
LINALIRHCLLAGLFVSFSGAAVDQALVQLNHMMGQANALVVSAQKEHHSEHLRPPEEHAIGNYLETPSLTDVYPGLKQFRMTP